MNEDLLSLLDGEGVSSEELLFLKGIAPVDAFASLRTPEAKSCLDGLFFVYTTANAGIRISGKEMPAGLSLDPLIQSGLVRENGEMKDAELNTTPVGEVLASTLSTARMRRAIHAYTPSGTHPLVPILLAGRRSGGRLVRTFPAECGQKTETADIAAILSEETFGQFRRFFLAMIEAGCAVILPKSDERGSIFVFPPEMAVLLNGLIEQMGPEEYIEWSGKASHIEGILQLMDTLSARGEASVNTDLLSGVEGALQAESKEALMFEDRGAGEGTRIILKDRGHWERLKRKWLNSLGKEIQMYLSAGEIGMAKKPEVQKRESHVETITASSSPNRTTVEVHAALQVERKEKVVQMHRKGDLSVFLGHSDAGDAVSWVPAAYNNGHFIIIGGSGAGKTETLRVIATELERQYYPVLMIDFHGDMLPKEARAITYRIREGGEFYFNPLELDPLFRDITPLRATSDFVDALSINFPTLGIQQRRKIKEIVKDAYRRHGITPDSDTWLQEVPFDAIEEGIMSSDDETLAAYLEDIFDYRLFSGTNRLSIKEILHRGTTHIQLSALPENLRYLFADLLLRRLFYSLQALGEIPRDKVEARDRFRLFVIVDEAKLLVSQKTGQKQVIKAVLNKYATEMRKFGVGLILASQLISHFNDEILANIAVKFCMRTENRKQAMENSRYFEISESDLMNFIPGEGILISGSRRTRLKILPLSMRGRSTMPV
ncbi:MAG: ATP-binding protein [Methanomicrobiales archaeon]|nr:ATP-binding protein [Methanomicrobiales archaeon]